MNDMTDERSAEVLAAHNQWRRYDGETGVPGAPEMGDPAEIGLAIDHAVSRLRSQPSAEAQASAPVGVDAIRGAMVFRLAVWMAKKDGHDDPHHLIWEGSPPEPWGEVWNRYEDDARSALTAALAAQQGGRSDD